MANYIALGDLDQASREVEAEHRNCGHCANWMQLPTAPNAGFCRLASTMRTTHSGQSERFGLMTTDLQVCSQWMDANPK